MKVFVFKSSNHLIGSFRTKNLDTLNDDLKVFATKHKVSLYDYLEVDGRAWTIIDIGDSVEIQLGRVDKISSKAVPIPISTTNEVAGHTTEATIGVVGGEAIMGTNIFRDIIAGLSDIVGGRSGVYEKKLREGRSLALKEMRAEAKTIGANAVVGVRVDYSSVSEQKMLMICASGTAVKINAPNIDKLEVAED